MILLFSGINWKKEYFLSFIGLIFFIFANNTNVEKSNNNRNFIYGFVMIIIAAITEALIYFLITNIKTNNSWNHLFIAYFLGSILSSIYIFQKYIYSNQQLNQNQTNQINLSMMGLGLLINGIIGSVGYWLRFYSVYRLEPGIYSILSFFGIIMAYFYGIVFGGETIDIYKIIGTLLIILSNYLTY